MSDRYPSLHARERVARQIEALELGPQRIDLELRLLSTSDQLLKNRTDAQPVNSRGALH